MHTDLTTLCLRRGSTFREAVLRMDKSRLGIVLVVDEESRLMGTITDGDLRRAILADVDLESPVEALLARKAGSAYAHPVTAPAGQDGMLYASLLKEHRLLHLPLLDEEDRVVGLVTLDEFVPREEIFPTQALIMAGGAGERLRPLTESLPKPMLPVGDRPLMEIIIGQLREAGIRRVNVATHHEPEKITSHFGDGQKFGVELSYLSEDRPLGTAGALGLMETPKETLLVINGDILTDIDFQAMGVYHKEHQADLTVAVRQCDLKVPYGVIECEGAQVRTLSEKPTFNVLVNAGIYLLEPSVYPFIPAGERFDMTELIQRLLLEGRTVISFPVREYWLDIGQMADYEQAQEQIKNFRRFPNA